MFFIGGISQKQEYLNFQQLMECKNCNQYTQVKIIMVYTYFSFFFIPLFKWGKRYFVQLDCCKSICELDKETGRQIEKGIITSLDPSSLSFQKTNRIQHCTNCGFQTQENFSYCPRCGNKLQ